MSFTRHRLSGAYTADMAENTNITTDLHRHQNCFYHRHCAMHLPLTPYTFTDTSRVRSEEPNPSAQVYNSRRSNSLVHRLQSSLHHHSASPEQSRRSYIRNYHCGSYTNSIYTRILTGTSRNNGYSVQQFCDNFRRNYNRAITPKDQWTYSPVYYSR